MRTEKEIRKLAADLRDATTPGCECSECTCNNACSLTLFWALGEHETDPHAGERLSAKAAQNRMEVGR